MPHQAVKLVIPFRDGIVVCTIDDELWFVTPDGPYAPWRWTRI